MEELKNILVPPEMAIFEAVKRLNDAHKRIILIADEKSRLLGVVTDSNVRHAVLVKSDLTQPVSSIMVRNPVTVKPDTPILNVLTLMERTQAYQIPVVDDNGTILGAHFVDEILRERGERGERTAVIMAGGMGTRLLPMTADLPKPLIQVGSQPILFTVLDQLLAARFDRVYITVNYLAEKIENAVKNEQRYTGLVRFVHEEQRLGTAGALKLLPEIPAESFFLMNGDLLTTVAINEMMSFHQFERNIITVGTKQTQVEVPYGVVNTEGTRVTSLSEKPIYNYFISTGIYIVDPIVVERLPENQAYDMTDAINDILGSELRVGCFPIYEYWQDIGRPHELDQARNDFDDHF